MTTERTPTGFERVERLLKTGELVDRWDAAAELVRILQERETIYPRLIEAKRLTEAEAFWRNARLACAWTYTVEPRIELAGPHHYRNELQRALWLAEARGLVLPQPPKGGKQR